MISCTQMQEHLDVLPNWGVAEKLDFSYAGNAAKRLPEMIEAGTVKVGAIPHIFGDVQAVCLQTLIPNVCLCVAEEADKDGNLYTGPNTEETPTIVEATAFKSGVVIVQVNEPVDKVTRIDIPGEWVDVVVPTEEPCVIEPIMTRDPQYIKDVHVLQGMMAIKGIYAKHLITRMNHGIGFNTAAIELLLPAYGEELGLKGKICTNWVSNPIPAVIPAIGTGWVKSVVAFGSELGMEDYVRERSDVFFTGVDGSLRSNRCYAQMAGMYGIDMLTGSTLQMDAERKLFYSNKGKNHRIWWSTEHGIQSTWKKTFFSGMEQHDYQSIQSDGKRKQTGNTDCSYSDKSRPDFRRTAGCS